MVPPVVLVVEDDFITRMNTTEVFLESGFEVIEARDAASAITILKKNADIRLICTDVNMPGELDGIDLAMLVREHYPHINVIVVSGGSQVRDLPPRIPFLSKPFLSERLVDIAREQLGVSV